MRTWGQYAVHLDREGAEWLATEAEALFLRTRDYGWDEIARELRGQLPEREEES